LGKGTKATGTGNENRQSRKGRLALVGSYLRIPTWFRPNYESRDKDLGEGERTKSRGWQRKWTKWIGNAALISGGEPLEEEKTKAIIKHELERKDPGRDGDEQASARGEYSFTAQEWEGVEGRQVNGLLGKTREK